MSRPTANATTPGSDYWTGLIRSGPTTPSAPVPAAPRLERAELEAARRQSPHGPYYVDAASGVTCKECGAYVPGGWTWRCLQGYQR
jgi:hypothetical protein